MAKKQTKKLVLEANSIVKVILESHDGRETFVTVQFPNQKAFGVKSSGSPGQIAKAFGLLATQR